MVEDKFGVICIMFYKKKKIGIKMNFYFRNNNYSMCINFF